MKNKNKIKNRKKYLWLFLLFPAVAGFYITQAGTTSTFDFTNFAWIGNNLQTNQSEIRTEAGNPVIGMISTRGDKYKLTMSTEGNIRKINGYAWLGIGTEDDKHRNFTDGQTDLPTLGWIGFNNTTPPGNCFGMGDCHSVQWSKKANGTELEGYLSGWARMFLGKDGTEASYPETWVHFRSPSSTDYSCDGKNNYFVCSDKNGRMNGYAWSAGSDSVFIEDNPGLGWINFSEIVIGRSNCLPSEADCCIKDGTCNESCPYDPDCVSPAAYSSCYTLVNEGEGKSDNLATGKTIKFENTGNTIKLSVWPDNTIKDGDNDFIWDCDGGQLSEPSNRKDPTCIYTKAGSFSPKLLILDEERKIRATCNPADIKIVDLNGDEGFCEVLVREKGYYEDNESSGSYSADISTEVGKEIEAIIKTTFLEGPVVWGEISPKNSSKKAFFTVKTGGEQIVRASINGKECSPANIKSNDFIRWR